MPTLEWQKGKPRFEGLYLVAVRYPNGLGELDFYHWKGEWQTLYDEELVPSNYRVMGYTSTQGMMSFFRGQWPEWDEEK